MSSPAFRPDERLVPMRLQRFLARAGVASRRGSEDLMTAGRVCVNGIVTTELGSKVDPACDRVTVDGVPVVLGAGATYIMLNKPAGFITTMRDPHGRPTVAELVPTRRYPGLFPVGRLDLDTTGLLLFTTDGDFGQALLHPSHHVWKTYLALVDGILEDDELEPLRRGIELDDGLCQPARCRLLTNREIRQVYSGRPPAYTTFVEVKIREGRKNQVKRMLSIIHHPVLELHRTQFGSLRLDDLPMGEWRELDSSEVALLKDDAGIS
ncbi:rRNA pseudouridine synthase [Collinsella sp. BA40]|uniref:pseudouridine synthase n=1 Tax=Collinsella sp. BA40 TaxID=2560852 RepID=UPI0011C7FA16|nr:pseudouridine synthase [Collinsella sp. BA40]TXF36668.1 rRNA pseudouridine synthase [Collinsella sp. BA40]